MHNRGRNKSKLVLFACVPTQEQVLLVCTEYSSARRCATCVCAKFNSARTCCAFVCVLNTTVQKGSSYYFHFTYMKVKDIYPIEASAA